MIGTSNVISSKNSTNGISAAYAGRIDELWRAVDAAAEAAEARDLTNVSIWHHNFRDGAETPGNAFKPIREALHPDPFITVGVVVPAAPTGSVHDRQQHYHGLLFTTPDAEPRLDQATRTRNAAVPRSCQFVEPDETRGGVRGAVGYMAGRGNLGRAGSRVFLSKDAKLAVQHEVLCETRADENNLGIGRVSGPIPSTRSRPTSNARKEHDSSQGCEKATIAEVGGQPTIMGGSAASAGGRDETTLSVATPHLRLVVSNDLLGTNYVDQGTLDQYDGGIIPVRVARAIRLKLQSLGWRHKDLAGAIGKSRFHTTNALNGEFGLSGWPVARLKSWMADPNPTRPEPSRKPKARRPERRRNQGDPRQLDLVDFIASLPIAA